MIRRVCTLVAMSLSLVAAGPAPQELPQGWTATEREIFWNSPQGSRIVPYDWFLRLEEAEGAGAFAAPAHMALYGYLASTANATNPDALPIGFARERSRDGSTWLGMTCAACHTGAIGYRGRTLLIQGGAAMADTQRFDRDLSAALVATGGDDGKFERLANRLGTLEADRPALRERIRAVAAARSAITAMNTPPHDHGPGRVDAMGVIMNALTATALDRPGNARAPDAPVRLPWVWNSPSYNRVQYNGSISNAGMGPLLRNIGQTLGVYGTVDATAATMGYPSSASVPDLEKLEALLRRLKPPAWPGDVLPPIDDARAARGRLVFEQACASCHGEKARDANGLVQLPAIPLEQIGTDPRAARNFMTRPAETGMLEGRPITVYGGPAFGPRGSAAAVVAHISTAVAAQVPRDRLQAGLNTYRAANAAAPPRLDAYKAIPLAGAWAGGPYLHNGSVANLVELLTPPPERATRFTVGGRDFDPVSVGYPADTAVAGFVLDTTLPGNTNTGHEYGTTLPAAEKADLIEFLKSL